MAKNKENINKDNLLFLEVFEPDISYSLCGCCCGGLFSDKTIKKNEIYKLMKEKQKQEKYDCFTVSFLREYNERKKQTNKQTIYLFKMIKREVSITICAY